MGRNLCVIPARMASSRYPGKPLAPLLGLGLVLHVWERCRLAKRVDRVIIATCDEEIRLACERQGADVVMTDPDHPGCVDRTAEAIALVSPVPSGHDLVLMVQGDEVMVTPDMLDAMVGVHQDTGAPVVNLISRLRSTSDHDDPNRVKCCIALDGRALFFSRSPIPSRVRTDDVPMYQQTGIIGFSADFLTIFQNLSRTPMEIAEGIDMLRTLEHGYEIRTVPTDAQMLGVDTPNDRIRAEQLLRDDPVTRAYLDFGA
jgi:3-deoxy-manno-octulosonate cytidylyltransferase (CMP-KDO synthetase)